MSHTSLVVHVRSTWSLAGDELKSRCRLLNPWLIAGSRPSTQNLTGGLGSIIEAVGVCNYNEPTQEKSRWRWFTYDLALRIESALWPLWVSSRWSVRCRRSCRWGRSLVLANIFDLLIRRSWPLEWSTMLEVKLLHIGNVSNLLNSYKYSTICGYLQDMLSHVDSLGTAPYLAARTSNWRSLPVSTSRSKIMTRALFIFFVPLKAALLLRWTLEESSSNKRRQPPRPSSKSVTMAQSVSILADH